MRCVMTRVLPLPGPARISTGPCVVVTALRCGSFNPTSKPLCSNIITLQIIKKFEILLPYILSEQSLLYHTRQKFGDGKIDQYNRPQLLRLPLWKPLPLAGHGQPQGPQTLQITTGIW